MSTINDGGPAYPVNELDHATGNVAVQHLGMSLRDHFAGLAMAALIAEPPWNGPTESKSLTVRITERYTDNGPEVADHLAEAAYILADAMLRAREKQA
jgi:hypothetical protein